jgi:DNA modification methylase
MDDSQLQIQHRPVADLRPHPRNARTHSPAQLGQIADSIRTFGFTNPILLDEQDQVLAGHGRLLAARQIGLETVPTVRLGTLSEAQKRAYLIADNRIAQLAGWDRKLLGLELGYLANLDVDFDVTITGFDLPAIDLLIQEAGGDGDPADDLPELPNEDPPITRPGDLFVLGRHRLLCGDAREPDAYGALLGDERAQVVFTDPPYNVPITGHVSGLGRIQHREFVMGSGEMSSAEFTEFLATVCAQIAAYAADGALAYLCIDWRHIDVLQSAARPVFSDLKNLCIWNKTNAGMGSLYRSQHELVFVYKVGTAPHINNVELGRHGRYRTNVWTYPGVNTFRSGRDDELALHPTVKPVALVADVLLDASRRHGLVLDPFGGSGTTLIAAEKTGRHAALLELDPLYVDVTVRRWQRLTGDKAMHPASGLTFDALAHERSHQPSHC